jgi:hypothetical protein
MMLDSDEQLRLECLKMAHALLLADSHWFREKKLTLWELATQLVDFVRTGAK